jgi:hypothetical protein
MLTVWLWLPVGPIRTSTVLAALVLFFVIAIGRRDPLRAVVAVVAWSALFEVVYQAVGIVGFHWAAGNWVWETAALAGWLVFAGVLGVWPDCRLIPVFVILMTLWIAAGYHYNVAGQTAPINMRDEVLNEASKTALALAYLVGALRNQVGHRRGVRGLAQPANPE